MDEAASVSSTFAALAEPNRFRIVELLRGGPRTVNAIADDLSLKQPQASKHLRHLREAGLVDAHPRAQRRIYALRPEHLHQMHTWIERYRRVWEQRFESLDALLAELEPDRSDTAPERKDTP